MNNMHSRAILSAALISAGGSAWAIEPAGLPVAEGVVFTPTLKLSASYDDNFRAVEKNRDSSWVTTIAPTLTLGAEGSKAKASLSYTLNQEIYHSSHDDDNADHRLDGQLGLDFDARNRLRLNAGYQQVEETATLDQRIENDKYNQTSVGGQYLYGADSATGQLRFGYNYSQLRYDNGYSNGVRLNADKERDTNALSAAFLYRLSAKTRGVLEARHTDYAYRSNTALDSTNTALLLGAEWEATALTTGSLRVGQERKDFDAAGKDSQTRPMWEAGLSWAPLTYSTFTLNTRSAYDEGSDSADAIEATSINLGWEHGWAERLKSSVGLSHAEQDYVSTERRDRLNSLSLGLTYNLRRWMDLSVGYKYTDNDSSRAGKSYDRNVFGVTLNSSL